MVTVDDIDIESVNFVKDKIKMTKCRLKNLKKWNCKLKFWTLKNIMISKLRWQLDFLKRVSEAK
jgi:hypothetical protein